MGLCVRLVPGLSLSVRVIRGSKGERVLRETIVQEREGGGNNKYIIRSGLYLRFTFLGVLLVVLYVFARPQDSGACPPIPAAHRLE